MQNGFEFVILRTKQNKQKEKSKNIANNNYKITKIYFLNATKTTTDGKTNNRNIN